MKQILLIAIAVGLTAGCGRIKTKDNTLGDQNKLPVGIHPYEKIILQDKSPRSRSMVTKLIKNETSNSDLNGASLVKIPLSHG